MVSRFRLGVSALLVLATLGAAVFLFLRVGRGAAQRDSTTNRVVQLDRSLDVLKTAAREIPRDTWDPDYIVRTIGRDPRRLFEWTRNNTYWIPYHGVLRGPVGVLMDRQGNSLDRSVLLAILLRKGGYTVRLAHGALPADRALGLLPRLEAQRAAAFAATTADTTAVSDPRHLAERDGHVASEQVFPRLASELRSRVVDQADRLLKVIARPDARAVWAATFDQALAALADHWWVQVQAGRDWVALDLLADSPGAALVPALETRTPEDLPAALHHTVTVRVIAEQWADGKLSEHKTLEQILRPSDLFGHSVTLQFWPTEWFKNDDLGARHNRTEALRQEAWNATLAVDENLLEAGLLTENGDDPNAAVKGGEMGSLGAALARGLGAGQDANRHLSAVWIEYEIHVPDQKPRIVRRSVFDLIGPAGRGTPASRLALDDEKRLTRSFALTMKTEILPLASGLSPQFVAALLSKNLTVNRDLLSSVLTGVLPAGTPDPEHLFSHSEPQLSTLYGLALARLELSDRARIFIDRPTILTRHQYAAPKEDGIALVDATDIVANDVGVSLIEHDPFAARLAQGVLDTNAEFLFRSTTTPSLNTGEAFTSPGSWVALPAEQDRAANASMNLPSDVRRQIASDVDSGYAVVAPQQAVLLPAGRFAGWWRVDRLTGSALGMGENGWGTVMPERGAKDSQTALISPIWKARIKTFAVAFVGNMGWCVTPLIGKQMDSYAEAKKLHHGLGIWEGAIAPLVDECAGDSIYIAALTAWLLPVGIVGEANVEGRIQPGQSEPIEATTQKSPPEPPGNGKGTNQTGKPGKSSNPEPNPNAENNPNPEAKNQPKDDPCRDTTRAGDRPSDGSNPGPEGPPRRSEMAQDLRDQVWATEQAAFDLEKVFIKAHSEMLQYRAQAKPIYNANNDIIGYEGPTFDPKVYQQLENEVSRTFADSDAAFGRAIAAERAWNEFVAQQLKQGPGGLCGGGGRNAQNPVPAGNLDALEAGKTLVDELAQFDGRTMPGGLQPPTPINEPSGNTLPGVGGSPSPNQPSGTTLRGLGPGPTGGSGGTSTQQSWDGKVCPYCSTVIPTYPDSSGSDPKSQSSPQPSGSVASSAQKAAAGLTGTANALGGRP